MKPFKFILAFCVFAFASTMSVAAQEEKIDIPNYPEYITLPNQMRVTRMPDGSLNITSAEGRLIYLDAEGNETTEAEQDAFLEANDKYRKKVTFDSDGNITTLLEKVMGEMDDILGQTLPTLTYTDINGEKVSIIDGEQTFLLIFWGISCAPCMEELQVLNDIAGEFPDLRIVAIASERRPEIKSYMEERDLQWNNITIITDYKEDYLPIIQSKVHPTTVLVSKAGVIEKLYFGNKIRQMVVDMDALANNI